MECCKRENIKARFEKLTHRHNPYTVWSDFVTLSAISISNAVCEKHKTERQHMYQRISANYLQSEIDIFKTMLGEVVCNLESNPDQDFLGHLFMALELGSKSAGQFFTPYSVSRLMAAMQEHNFEQITEKEFVSVNDPACGAGGLLIAFANQCLKKNINYQKKVFFVAQDIDFTAAMMCYIQLSLLGCPGYVVVGDTLANPPTCLDANGFIPCDAGNIWYTPMYFLGGWKKKAVNCLDTQKQA